MARNVNTYLEELRAELTGVDPALAQDALYDAEDHLRAELAVVQEQAGDQVLDPNEAIATVIERYGTPREVATAYLEAEAGPAVAAGSAKASTVALVGTPPPQPPPGFLAVMADPRTWNSLAYMLLSLATGIVYFTLAVTGVSLSAGLAVFIVGVPFALLFLAMVRAVSLAEGRVVEVLLGVRMPRRPRLGPSEAGIWQRVLYWLKDRRTWTALLYMVLQLPLGIVYFTVSITGLATGLALMFAPFVQLVHGHRYVNINDSVYLISWWQFPLMVIGGVLLILVTLNLVRLAGRAHAVYAKAMLVHGGQPATDAAAVPQPTNETTA